MATLVLFGAANPVMAEEQSTKEMMQEMYGENQIITGDYNEELAVACQNGIYVGLENDGIVSYKGIPYAKAPINELRWKTAEKPDDSSNVYEAYYFGKSAIQTETETERASLYVQGEDCLSLNIWTAESTMNQLKPVIVFIHGGSYGWGGTSDPLYDAENFVKAHPEIVFVTINYRTGIMGFMDFSEVEGGEEYTTSGNLGLLDQKCALEWIQENISGFGGDASNVTIVGESAGAGSVSLLPLIEGTEGLFQRVIAESGSVALTYSKEECLGLTEMLMEETGAETMDDLLALSEEELKEVNEQLNDYNNFPERDGVVLPEDLYEAYANGAGSNVDMLIGTNQDEARYWIGEVGGLPTYTRRMPLMVESNISVLSVEDLETVNEFIDSLDMKKIWKYTEFYNEIMFRLPAIKQAESHADNGGDTYMYYWTYPSALPNYGACHAVELAYVFNNLEDTIYTGDNIDVDLAEEVQNMWVNFAINGNPSTENNKWSNYNSTTRYTMVLGSDIRLESDLLSEQREQLTDLLAYNFNGNYSQLNFNVPFIRKLVIAGVIIIAGIIFSVVMGIRKFHHRRDKKEKIA